MAVTAGQGHALSKLFFWSGNHLCEMANVDVYETGDGHQGVCVTKRDKAGQSAGQSGTYFSQ